MFNLTDILLDDYQGVIVVAVVVGCILGLKADVVLPRGSSRQCEESFQFFGSIHGIFAMAKSRSIDPINDAFDPVIACLISTSPARFCPTLIRLLICGARELYIGEKDSSVACAGQIRRDKWVAAVLLTSVETYRSFIKRNSGSILTCISDVRRCLPLDQRYRAAQCPK